MPPATEAPLRLTAFARCAGCAAKMGPGELSRVLGALPAHQDARILVGRETFDDAAVVQLDAGLALVQTVDFFAPIVDDPYAFGQIAAANALSDVYAMGGEPLTALNLVGFPVGRLPHEVLAEILRGGQDKVHEAGALVVGGHSVVDEEVKYGLAVTGRVDPRRVLTNAAAHPGDRLVLTKALGTGILATALKRGWLEADVERRLVEQMARLNREAARAAADVGARCATDVTGFGLLGHASHVARASGVTLRIRAASVPVLPGARELLRRGASPGGAARNLEYVAPLTDWQAVDDETRALLADPQTSGGLLLALPEPAAADYLARVPTAVEIGCATAPGERQLVLE
ncbi:MAG TPA: selenide, water dikinase SelD [Gemmatimonadaceae bacterium]|nr:selenide, water dikinase SelD [Gemmatimonadaceae bacterium]